MTTQSSQSNLSDDDLILLSSYLDNQLTAAERLVLERRLKTDAALRAELEELRAVTTLLRELSPVIPPRSFTLDLTQVPVRRPWRSGWMRYGSALAALLLTLTVTGLFVIFGMPGGASPVAQLERAATAPVAREMTTAGDQENSSEVNAEETAAFAADSATGKSAEEKAAPAAAPPSPIAPFDPTTPTSVAGVTTFTEPGPEGYMTPEPAPYPVPPEGAAGVLSAYPEASDTLGQETQDLVTPPPASGMPSILLPLVVIGLALVILIGGAWYAWRRRSAR